MLTVGELFAGYGGMSLGLDLALGETRVIWYAENAPAPAAVMARHHPYIPNLGDVTRRDWATIPRVDILTGGTPCQDVSHAGKRAGMKPGTRSGLWAAMTDAIEALRPKLVIWENVRGATSADADSGLEWCPGCMGDPRGKSHLRALGRVLGDLADLGFNARWAGLPAAATGAPHKRYRLFLAATTRDTDGPRLERRNTLAERPGKRATRPDDLGARPPTDWGPYADAVARWELELGRPAPPPTEPNTKGGHRLSAPFVEWMMGLPPGWVTDTPGISRADTLACLGNGIVPQQLAAALAVCLDQVAPPEPKPASPLLPTPLPFNLTNTEPPEQWRERRLDVYQRTGTRHGAPLSVIIQSIADGHPITPDRYMPDEVDDE